MKEQMKAVEKLMKKGNYFEALKAWSEFLDREDRLDIEHLNFIDMGIDISLPLYGKRYFDKALDGFRTVYEKRLQILGPAHTDTKNSLHRVIRVRFEKGEVEEAFDMCRNLDDCIAVQKSLATELFERKEYEKALHFFQRAYEEAVESLGADDAETLTIRLNVARVLSTLGRYRESMEASKEVAEKQEKILGASHNFTLTSWRAVALSLLQLNEQDECLKVLNKTYQKAVRVLGRDHNDSLQIQKQIAQTLAQLGRSREAVRVYQDVLEHLDPDKPGFLETKNAILDLLLKLGKPDEARQVYNMVYEILIRKHTKEYDILEEQIAMAENYAKENKFTEAADQYRQVYNVRKEVFGSEDSKTLSSQYKITEMLLKASECEEAFSIVSDLLDKRVRTLGLENGDTLQTMMLKARILARQEKFHDSISVLEHIVSVRDRLSVTSDNVSDFVTALTNAGSIYVLMGDYNRALHKFTKSCRLRVKYPRYTDVMGSDKDIVPLLWSTGKSEEIIQRFTEFRNVCHDSAGSNSHVLLIIQIILGEFLYLDKSFEEALKCFKKAQEILTTFTCVEDDLPVALQTKIYMGKIFLLQSKLDDALKVLKCVYAKLVMTLGKDHPESKDAEHNLIVCLKEKAKRKASGTDAEAKESGAEGGSQSGSEVKESAESEESVEMKDVSAEIPATAEATKSPVRKAGTSQDVFAEIPAAAETTKSPKRKAGTSQDVFAEIPAAAETTKSPKRKAGTSDASAEIPAAAEAIKSPKRKAGTCQDAFAEIPAAAEAIKSPKRKAGTSKDFFAEIPGAAETTKSPKRKAGTSKIGQRVKPIPIIPRSAAATDDIIAQKVEEIILDALGPPKNVE